jgi:hypothetical protein
MRILAALLLLTATLPAQPPTCPRMVPSQIALTLSNDLIPGPYPYTTASADFWIFCDSAPSTSGVPLDIQTQGPLTVAGNNIIYRESDRTYAFPFTLRTLSTTVSPAAGDQPPALLIHARDGHNVLPVTITFTGSPFIYVADKSLTFEFPGGSEAQKLTLWFPNATTRMPFTVSTENAAWLSVTPTTGSGYTELTVRPDPTGLSFGNYMGYIVITAAGTINSPFKVPVRFLVPVPQLLANPPMLSFSQTVGAPPPAQQVTVNVDWGAALPFRIVSDASWLSATPTEGTTPATISVKVNGTGLTAGTYSSQLRVVGDIAKPAAVNVSFRIQ